MLEHDLWIMFQERPELGRRSPPWSRSRRGGRRRCAGFSLFFRPGSSLGEPIDIILLAIQKHHGQSVARDIPATWSERPGARQSLLGRPELLPASPGLEEQARGGMDGRVRIVSVESEKVRSQADRSLAGSCSLVERPRLSKSAARTELSCSRVSRSIRIAGRTSQRGDAIDQQRAEPGVLARREERPERIGRCRTGRERSRRSPAVWRSSIFLRESPPGEERS